ncbi:hypothetical protein ACMD2_23636, partial [Ananas comosus]
FHHRFNISYQEDRDEEDGVEYDSEENGRPSFLSIEKSAGFLDKELAASGFTKRDQDEIEKFIEGGPEPKDGSSSDDESSGKEQTADEDNETVTTKMVALQLADQQVKSSCCNDEERVEENLDSCNVKVVRENEPTASGEQEDSNDLDDSDDDDGCGDAELVKRLTKQRKRAVAAARGRRALASRTLTRTRGVSRLTTRKSKSRFPSGDDDCRAEDHGAEQIDRFRVKPKFPRSSIKISTTAILQA